MSNAPKSLNTIFLGIIAAVAVGAALVWWSNQPTAAERRHAEMQQATDRLQESVDRYIEASERARRLSGQ